MGKDIPDKLFDILRSESWIKVGVAVEQDLKHLSDNFELGHCSGAIEIKNLALLAKCKSPSLEYLFNQFIGGHIKKGNSICDWSQELSEKELIYAASDAIMSLRVFNDIIQPTIDYMIQVNEDTDNRNGLDIYFVNYTPTIIESTSSVNYIGRLNEFAQKNKIDPPEYVDSLVKVNGLHKFRCQCYLDKYCTESIASSKKLVKKEAAKKMYQLVFHKSVNSSTNTSP